MMRNLIVLGICLLASISTSWSLTTNLYFTRFEPSEGFDPNLPLAGQNGWRGFNAGTSITNFDNGFVTNFFTGEGQNAYIGFSPPPAPASQILVWQPIDYLPPTNSLVKFSVLLMVVDSTFEEYDDFNWTAYNTDGDPLFAINFNNFDTNIYYDLDGTNTYVRTGKTFGHDTPYTLQVLMDFPNNKWSATLNHQTLVTNKAITTVNARRDLGDFDLTWLPFKTNAPGNNYMVFDNYTMTAILPDEPVSIPPKLLSPAKTLNGPFSLTVQGQESKAYVVEGTTNLVQWVPIKTNVVFNGTFDFLDSSTANFGYRFYRARLVK
jgi:hypothetical protein